MLGCGVDHYVAFWYTKDGNNSGGAPAFLDVGLIIYLFPLTVGLRGTCIAAAHGPVSLRSVG
jgi:hypothetical protein